MFSKQSRLIRSSSLGGSVDSLKNPVQSAERKHRSNALKPIQIPVIKKNDAAIVKRAAVAVSRPVKAVAEKPRKSIFTFSSPIREKEEDKIKERSEAFLYICALCKKKIPWNEDIYMYGYLQAFCSTRCRDDKILLDGEFSPPSRDCGQTRNTMIRNHFNVEALFRKLRTN